MRDVSNRLLIVDDEAGVRDTLGTVAEKLGFEVQATGSANDFADLVQEFKPTALILDLNLAENDGNELLRYLAKEQSEAQVLVVSDEDPPLLNAAERLGLSQGLRVAGALQKPILRPDLEAILKRMKRESVTEADLLTAIESRDLRLDYQPKLSLDRDGIWSFSGAEALVRWHHPELGILMPKSFIPMAEETGLIGPLTDFVMREALEQNALWSEQGLDMNMAVNIAPQLLLDNGFADRLSLLLHQCGLEGSRLTLEITETATMNKIDMTIDTLVRLRHKDIGLSVADFGTGYSSMKQLFCMPYSELKIHRSFITKIPQSAKARTIVKTLIQLAHNLNMTACAESVESQAVLDFLDLAGCNHIQGYFICEPVCAREFEEFVSVWTGRGVQKLIGIGRR